jgi:hypothetical protein
MRFILLARERITGGVRPLSKRAFDSQSAAVDAATVTAHLIDLRDDEVFAVDLDDAGPVLVLRIEVPAAETPVPTEQAAARPWRWLTPAAPEGWNFGAAASGEAPQPNLELEPEAFASEIVLRLQPRYPLFGVEEMGGGERAASESRLGVPPDGRYSAEDESDLMEAREEGRLLSEAAALRFDTDEIRESEAIDFRMSNGDVLPVSEEDAVPMSNGDVLPVSEEDAVPMSNWDETPASGGDGWRVEDAASAADEPAVVQTSEIDELPVEAPLLEESDIGYALPTEAPEADIVEQLVEAELIVPDAFAFEGFGEVEPPPEGDATTEQEEPGADAAPLQETAGHCVMPPQPMPGEEVFAARALFAEPEPEPYRASDTTFAIWVCADCVFQRTCRRAGIATPASCGNFQWKSF